MASDIAFKMLRADLGFAPGSVPEDVQELMLLKLDAAAAELEAAGVPVDETLPQDLDLLVLYAAWLYRGRVQQQDKPLMLRQLLRNRQAARPMGGAP